MLVYEPAISASRIDAAYIRDNAPLSESYINQKINHAAMKANIPILKFSLVQAAVSVVLQVFKLMMSYFFAPNPGFLFDAPVKIGIIILSLAIIIVAILYFISGAACSFVFNKISEKKKKEYSVFYVVAAQTIIFFFIGLLRNWTNGLELAFDTFFISVFTALMLFNKPAEKSGENEGSKEKIKAKKHFNKHKSKKR